MTNAILGAGTTLSYGTGIELAELFSVGYPSVEVADVKATHYGTTGGFHDYISGWKEGGTVECSMNYTSAQQITLHEMIGTPETWVITLPDGTTISFPGYIKSVGAEIPNEDKVVGKCTIKVTGEPEISAGA